MPLTVFNTNVIAITTDNTKMCIRDRVKAWKHTGDSIFSRSIDGLLPQIAYAANINTPILADVDGDAIPDIVFCCNNKFIYALHNDGSDILGFPIVSADENFLDTPCVADIDNDGRNEIIAGSEKDLYVWKTEGIPTAIEWLSLIHIFTQRITFSKSYYY